MLSSPPRRLARLNQVAAGVAGVEMPGERADLLVVDRPGEAVGAEQVDVGEPDGQRALDVDLDVRLGPEAAGDHVLGNRQVGLLGRQVVPPHQLPDQAMIERELIDPLVRGPGRRASRRRAPPGPLRAGGGATSRSCPSPGTRDWPTPGCGSGRSTSRNALTMASEGVPSLAFM